MAALVVQSKNSTGSSVSSLTTTALTAGVTAGNTVIIVVETENAGAAVTVTGITGGSGAFTRRQAISGTTSGVTNGDIEIWEGVGVAATTTRFVVTLSASTSTIYV